ncbi:MAG: hypothetical protein HGA45_30110 [Chloroflexales bacterium]|nr:hypothetical protein [Chloroflexales bacterium]
MHGEAVEGQGEALEGAQVGGAEQAGVGVSEQVDLYDAGERRRRDLRHGSRPLVDQAPGGR